MKKTLILLFVAALGAGTMSSCKKSNKGKLSGEWNLDTMTETSTVISGNPSTTTTTTVSVSGTAVTSVVTQGTLSTTYSGTVNSATWDINKDGSYSKATDITFTDTYVDGWSGTTHTLVTNEVETETGTWSFVKKNKTNEFKTNERVSFMATEITSVSNESDTPAGGTTTTYVDSDTDTYADGSNVTVFLITESKGKSLTMTSDDSNSSGNSYTSGATTTTSTTTTTGSTTITMAQE